MSVEWNDTIEMLNSGSGPAATPAAKVQVYNANSRPWAKTDDGVYKPFGKGLAGDAGEPGLRGRDGNPAVKTTTTNNGTTLAGAGLTDCDNMVWDVVAGRTYLLEVIGMCGANNVDADPLFQLVGVVFTWIVWYGESVGGATNTNVAMGTTGSYTTATAVANAKEALRHYILFVPAETGQVKYRIIHNGIGLGTSYLYAGSAGLLYTFD